MQFELSSGHVDATKLAAAMHPLDPAARVIVDSATNHLEVISSATTEQVQRVLAKLGYAAPQLKKKVHISRGTTCCGGCS